MSTKLILASRSPRRRELLGLLMGGDRFEVIAPSNSEERGFDDCHDMASIERRMREIAATKIEQVRRQIGENDPRLILAADTIVVARENGGSLVVLGQPPDQQGWETVVREWFSRYYFDKSHLVMTAVTLDVRECLLSQLVKSEVSFRDEAKPLVEWYLSTGESIGKAGGYGIQGAAGLFVDRVEGSLTNIIGLPMLETRLILEEAGLIEDGQSEKS